MKCKLNIIEPWESGTDKSIEANILKFTGKQFLLFVEKSVKVGSNNAHYFVCKFKNEKVNAKFKSNECGTYEISMIFDINIQNAQQELPDIESYRANFLSGELIF